MRSCHNRLSLILSGILRIEKLCDVQAAVWDARSEYYNIGIALGVPAGDLDAFKRNGARDDDCFVDVLKHCLRQPEGLSQKKLADALASKPVAFGGLAEEIRNKKF